MNFKITFIITLFFASSVLASSDGCHEALESKYNGTDLMVAVVNMDVIKVQKIATSGSYLDSFSVLNAFTFAYVSGSSDIVRIIAEEILEEEHINARDGSEESRTALMHVSRQGNADILRILLEAGAKVDSQDSRDKTDKTALMLATEKGHSEIVRVLLEFDANVYLQDLLGRTVLMYAILYGHSEIVLALLESGMLATEEGHSEVFRLLLEAGAKVNKKKYNAVEIARMIKRSEEIGYDDMVNLLIEGGIRQNRNLFSGIAGFFKSLGNK